MKSIILLFAIAAPLLARIGETVKECDARYLNGGRMWASGKGYDKANMRITPTFRDDVCVWIEYSRVPQKGTITEAERDTLMQANEPGAWSPVANKPSGKSWLSPSGKATAYHSPTGAFLVITTVAETETRKAEKIAKSSLDGL